MKPRSVRELVKQGVHAVKLVAKRSALAPAVTLVMRRRLPLTRPLELGRKDGWEKAARWLLSSNGKAVLRDQYLLESLTQSINQDIEVELLLTMARKLLLREASELLKQEYVQEFVCALIQQCINNEYVWYVSDEEKKKLCSLSFDGRRIEFGSPVALERLFLLAMYEPFHEILGTDSKNTNYYDGLPACLRVLIQNHMKIYKQEMEIKRSIKRLGTIHEGVSRKVAAMYESYPYPRWLTLTVPAAGSRRDFLKTYFDESELGFLDRKFDVLVAGCGTGRKAIQIALGYGDQANVLAIDLSRSSLAYAARMARKYHVKNIRFVQSDIMDLPVLEQQFDIVECTGVLVCMADPLKGWRILLDRTRAGGVMHISLYSELARRVIVELRKTFEHELTRIDTDYIRRYRHHLMISSPDTVEALPTRSDFFDLSRCKDLLFHPVEHRFSIPQIAKYLADLGLEFRGFEEPKPLANKYWSAFPRGKDQRNLEGWWKFEQENPNTFGDLYEIWCRKVGSHSN